MTNESIVVTGWGVMCAAGTGPEALCEALKHNTVVEEASARAAERLYGQDLPRRPLRVAASYDKREMLGRKGTAFLDRCSGLALVACGQALRSSGLSLDDESRRRTGVVLGTTIGSLKSMSDYTRETLTEERPYLVNAALFPNTVMNCAAGQTAIRFGLKGINSTIASGPMAFLISLGYCSTALRNGTVDAMVAGAVEELTPDSIWAAALTESDNPELAAGEGAAAFVLERYDAARKGSRHVEAEVLSVVTAYRSACANQEAYQDELRAALARVLRRALAMAEVQPAEVSLVVTRTLGAHPRDRVELAAVAEVVEGAERMALRSDLFGEAQAASGALQLGALLATLRDGPPGRIAVVTGSARDGGLGVAVVRGCHVGADRS